MTRYRVFFVVLLCGSLGACSPAEPLETTSAQRTIEPFTSSASSESSESSSLSPSALPITLPEDLTIPILVYHHIRETKPWHPSTWSWKMSVSPYVFEEQMQWLVDHGYTSMSLDDYAAIMAEEKQAPEKPVVITFDDNQLSSYEIGVPIMHERGLTATFYLIVNKLDDPNFIGRAQISDLLEKGMDIQSHTMTHANMTNLSLSQLDWQLTESRKILEEATGKSVRHVAYPLTAHNQTVRTHTKDAGYTTGTIMDPRPATAASDLHKLPRIMMTDETDLAKVLP